MDEVKPVRNMTIFFSVTAEEMAILRALRRVAGVREWRYLFLKGVVAAHMTDHISSPESVRCPLDVACPRCMAKLMAGALEGTGVTIEEVMKEDPE